MAMEFGQGNFNWNHEKRFRHLRTGGSGFGADGAKARYLIIELPSSCLMTVLVLSMLLACAIVLFPRLCLVLDGPMLSHSAVLHDAIDPEIVPLLFNDLAKEGLLRTVHKALFLIDSDDVAVAGLSSSVLCDIEIDLIHVTDLEHRSSIQEESFDLIFTHGYEAASAFIDRALKMDGVLVIQLSQDPFQMFKVPTNYRILYFRKFEYPVIAMKRQGGEQHGSDASVGRRRLMGMASEEEEKKAALRNLEDVLLEPPRSASRRSSRYLKKTRYLPDLMGDRLALEKYPRRVFIEVGSSGSGSTEWFARNYPTRNLDFEMYTIEMIKDEDEIRERPEVAGNKGQGHAEAQDRGGMSEWLVANVKEVEYVVMKANAEVVEEIVAGKATRLVDELFLECGPRSRRAYWECLALYGRLRDEGVAVHQWWG